MTARWNVPQTCPHCGIALPPVVDAYCPECREDLSETPGEAVPGEPAPAPVYRPSAGELANSGPVIWVTKHALLFAGCSFVVLVIAIASGQWGTAGGAAVVFLPCAAWVVAHYRMSAVKTRVTGRDKTSKGTEQPE